MFPGISSFSRVTKLAMALVWLAMFAGTRYLPVGNFRWAVVIGLSVVGLCAVVVLMRPFVFPRFPIRNSQLGPTDRCVRLADDVGCPPCSAAWNVLRYCGAWILRSRCCIHYLAPNWIPLADRFTRLSVSRLCDSDRPLAHGLPYSNCTAGWDCRVDSFICSRWFGHIR